MQLYLHPTRREALTATEKAITRWSLETNPATILAEVSTAPESVFSLSYDPGGRLHAFGGVTGSPDGLLFAHEQLLIPDDHWAARGIIEWRRWEDLTSARTIAVPIAREMMSLERVMNFRDNERPDG